jgi:hypothetical protein
MRPRTYGEIAATAHESRAHRCQVRNRQRPCLALARVEAVIAMPAPEGITQRTVRCCLVHFEQLARVAENRVIRTRPYVRPEAC